MIKLQKPVAVADEGDGPCKFYSDGHRWVLGDTYHEPRKLYLWDLYRSDVFTVNILGTADWPGPAHTLATLNPQWSPDGARLLCRLAQSSPDQITLALSAERHIHW